jgi:Arc/MetJ-type ribon-helix-helix transcriptional regulator
VTVHVELSPELEQAINERLRTGEFRNADDLVRLAIHRFIEDEREIAHTESLLEEAAASGDYIELDDRAWDEIERDATRIVEERRLGRV